MKKYLVLYMLDYQKLAAWGQTPEADRKSEEEKMQKEWMEWAEKYKDNIMESGGTGKTTEFVKGGVNNVHSDIMCYSIVQAENEEVIKEMFANHSHLQIPDAKIQIMPIKGF